MKIEIEKPIKLNINNLKNLKKEELIEIIMDQQKRLINTCNFAEQLMEQINLK